MSGVAKKFWAEVYAGIPVKGPRDDGRRVTRKKVKKLVRGGKA